MRLKFYLFIYFICFFFAFSQAKKPSLMLIPSDVWMREQGFGKENAQGYFEPDYRKAFQQDPKLLFVIGKMNTIMAEKGFPLNNLETQLNKFEQTSSAPFADAPAETHLEKMARALKTDMILQLTYNVLQEGPKNKVAFNLQAIDAYTQKQIAGVQGIGKAAFSSDVLELLEEAVLSHIDNFSSTLQKYFDKLFQEGRESKLMIRFANSTKLNVDEELAVNGERKKIIEWIEDYVQNNLQRGGLDSFDDPKKVDFQLYIPLLQKERAFTLNDWMGGFRNFLSKELQLKHQFRLKGLGEAWILIEGKNTTNTNIK